MKTKLNELREKLMRLKIPARLIFIVMGIASTVWFLLRVIPKPQRAAYPCMKAAAPIMSSFVIYLISLSGIVLAFRQSKKKFFQAKYLAAGAFLIASVISAAIFFMNDVKEIKAATLPDAPNTPMGTAQGIMPGRVAWAHCPDAICQGMENKIGAKGTEFDTLLDRVFYNPRFVYQPAIDSMVETSILSLANETNLTEAWDTIFKYFNNKKKGTPTGYKNTEKIFIKINLTGGSGLVPQTAYWGRLHPDLTRVNPTWQTNPDIVETNPFSVLSIIRQLVDIAGVPEDMIYIGDPMKNVYKDMADYWLKEFPDIHILANNYNETSSAFKPDSIGRTKVVKGTVDRIFYSDGTSLKDKLYTVMEEADYLINMAVLKAHNRNGITLCAKNHFGSQNRSSAQHLHGSLIAPDEKTQTNATYGKYRILVDIMGNKYMGGNTLLFIVDALVSAEKDWEGPAIKFKMAPFNNQYPASIFMSLDQVALESVCFDFLRTEFDPANTHKTSSPFTYGAIDDYLHQAADKANWPVGTLYKPNGDDIEIGSLGAHEHWNNASDKKYSRNIDPINGKGIELFSISFAMPHKWDTAAPVPSDTTPNRLNRSSIALFKIYPNPTSSFATIVCKLQEKSKLSIDIIDVNGRIVESIVSKQLNDGVYEFIWNCQKHNQGIYYCSLRLENSLGVSIENKRIQIIR